MSVEFIDTNILIYAHDALRGDKQAAAAELIGKLILDGVGALSTQVLAEFVSAGTYKLKMPVSEVEATINDLSGWRIHRPTHADILNAITLQRRYKIAWWDAMILNSAIESGAGILWSEDMKDGQRIGKLTIRNPFRSLRP